MCTPSHLDPTAMEAPEQSLDLAAAASSVRHPRKPQNFPAGRRCATHTTGPRHLEICTADHAESACWLGRKRGNCPVAPMRSRRVVVAEKVVAKGSENTRPGFHLNTDKRDTVGRAVKLGLSVCKGDFPARSGFSVELWSLICRNIQARGPLHRKTRASDGSRVFAAHAPIRPPVNHSISRPASF
ncbi:hypothetical protein N658DRAFT_203656 [Parathielavia hyrcaniae]|uniref:Uncharacterized protein n=1 Tax=Parathielavia hyrcaniae TaxID=113614 RepID=A0AAN6PW37_9PEZI|nr:hypothetical protein N658DRAFT_203656 [Parathielavia hyrcaniae]